LIRKAIEAQERGDKELVAWGDGSPTREFLYVEDAADGIVTAAEKYNGPEPVNLGSGYEISIKDLTEMVIRLTGFEGELVWDTEKPNGQPRRGLDVSRAKEYFGWQAQVPFEEGMRRTIEWFKANREKVVNVVVTVYVRRSKPYLSKNCARENFVANFLRMTAKL
jgi:GDP-L-fucose synthase